MYKDEKYRNVGPKNYNVGTFRGYKKGNFLAEHLKVACGTPQSTIGSLNTCSLCCNHLKQQDV
jgi:hypothetical protein